MGIHGRDSRIGTLILFYPRLIRFHQGIENTNAMLTKEKRQNLSEAERHVSTGTAHNKQLISIQADMVLAVDDLEREVAKLRETTVSLNEKNNTLQKAMAWLTGVTVLLAIVQALSIFI